MFGESFDQTTPCHACFSSEYVLYTVDAMGDDAKYGSFVADFKDLKDLKVRDGCAGYGYRAHFNSKQMPTAIYDYHRESLVKPTDKEWEHTKFALQQAMRMEVSGVKHLLDINFLCANSVCTNATLHLSAQHPLSRILTVLPYLRQ